MNNFVQFKYLKLIQRKCLCQFQYFNGIFPFQQEGNLTISWNRISKFEKRQYWKELFTLWRNQLSVDCVNINFPGHKFQYGVKKKNKKKITSTLSMHSFFGKLTYVAAIKEKGFHLWWIQVKISPISKINEFNIYGFFIYLYTKLCIT